MTEALEVRRSLQRAPLLEGLSDEVISEFSGGSWIRAVDKGEILFQQTDPARAVYLVQSGCITIYLSTADGRELVINEMVPGDCFGELSLITGNSFAAPHMAGLVARIMAKHPELTPFQIKTVLYACASNIHRS